MLHRKHLLRRRGRNADAVPSHRRRKRKAVVAVSVAAIALTVLPQQVAQAHSTWGYGVRMVWQTSNFCVRGSGAQTHNWHIIETQTTTSNCSAALWRNAGYIRHRAEWYVNGRYCHYIPEQVMSNSDWIARTEYPVDVFWRGCNNGVGVHVWITMDTWHWAAFGAYWYPNWGGWPGIRPVTGHCHCP